MDEPLIRLLSLTSLSSVTSKTVESLGKYRQAIRRKELVCKTGIHQKPLSCCSAPHEVRAPRVCKQECRPVSDTSSQWILCGLMLCWLNSDNVLACGFLRKESWIGENRYTYAQDFCWEQHLYFTCHEGWFSFNYSSVESISTLTKPQTPKYIKARDKSDAATLHFLALEKWFNFLISCPLRFLFWPNARKTRLFYKIVCCLLWM